MSTDRDQLTRRLRAYYDATPAYHGAPAPAGAEAAAWDPNERALKAAARPDDLVLDLAGGAGHLRARLGPCRYVATDLSLLALGSGQRGVAADARRLPFRDGTFDRVLCHHGLEHFADPAAALDEAVRVLRPGGRLILIGPSFDSPRQPLPMLAHRPAWERGRLRLRLCARLVCHELAHAIGRFRYRPLVIDDVASLHGVGPPDGDYDAVHPTQVHETVFHLEGRGLAIEQLALWAEHTPAGARGMDRLLARLPVLRWFVRTFPLVAAARTAAVADPPGSGAPSAAVSK